MTNFLHLMEQNPGQWLLVALAVGGILFLLVIVLWINLLSFKKRFKQLMRNASGDNIEQLLKEQLAEIKGHRELAEENRSQMAVLEDKLRQCIQYVGINRYNAFEDQGSRLSFSIAMLDESLDGIILTGIYGRHESTTYAKKISRGHSEQNLSIEELEALQMAREQHHSVKKS